MNNNERYKRLVRIIAAFIIIVVELAIYMFFWYKIISPNTDVLYWRKGNWVIGVLYAALIFFFSTMYGGFRLGYLEKENVIYSQILSLLIVNLLTYIQISLLAYRFPSLWIFICLSIADIVVIIIWVYSYDKLYRLLFPPKKVLLLYGAGSSEEIIEKLNVRKEQYNIVKALDINMHIKDILTELNNYESIFMYDINTNDRNIILKACFDKSICVYFIPKISDILIRSSEEMYINDTPLLLVHNNGLNAEQIFGKRCMDLILSFLMIIVLSPVMLVAALAIKLYDRGNIIYKQRRLTLNRKIFYIYKFRSMKVDAEQDGIARLAKKNDDRITLIGKLMRTTRIDELPQLFNVLKGDMSLVGPRPERPEIAEEYEHDLPQFAGRLKVKAGLTGYAQIYGKYNTAPYDKLIMDLTYIQNYSLMLDFKLILLTVKILFMKENTEGVEN